MVLLSFAFYQLCANDGRRNIMPAFRSSSNQLSRFSGKIKRDVRNCTILSWGQ